MKKLSPEEERQIILERDQEMYGDNADVVVRWIITIALLIIAGVGWTIYWLISWSL